MADSEDYVPNIPGANVVDPSYDYTNETPFDSSADDEEISLGFRTDKSAEDIEKDTYRPVPEGDHTLEVESIERQPTKTEKVYLKLVNGEVVPRNYEARKIKIVLAVVGDPMMTVNDNFVLPPTDPSEMEAYEYGFANEEDAKKKDRTLGGFWAKKLRYLLARLGFEFDAHGNPPPAAGLLKNWRLYPDTDVKRLIGVTVQNSKPRDYQKRDPETGEMKTMKGQAWPQVKMFSYRYVDPPAGVKASAAVKPPEPATTPKANKKG